MESRFPSLQFNEINFSKESYTPRANDDSFADKLKYEQQRWGLLFSPWNQLLSIFSSSPINQLFNATGNEASFTSEVSEVYQKEAYKPSSNPQSSNPNYLSTQPPNHPTTQLSDYSKSPQTLVTELFLKNNWLVPNLEVQSLFYQASLEGKLLAKLDLQYLIDQILEQVKLVKEKGKTELMVGLKPEDLGEILLTLTSRSGMVSIQINALPETRKLIETQLEELKIALKKAKIQLEEIVVQEIDPKKGGDRYA